MESWQKWSFPFSPLSQDNADPAGWTPVLKGRRITQFALTRGPIVARGPRLIQEPRCEVELTEVRIRGQHWWTLGLAKGDRAFGRHTFVASATLPAFVSGIFRVRFWLFLLGALVAGVFWIGMYGGISYLLGEEIAKLVGQNRHEGGDRRDPARRRKAVDQGRVVEVAGQPPSTTGSAGCRIRLQPRSTDQGPSLRTGLPVKARHAAGLSA
jgi:hypothetical protein